MIFTIPGEPEGKARPRVVRNQGKVHAFTPSKTKAYEERVRAAYIAAGGEHFGKKPLKMMIIAIYGLPKSATRSQREDMLLNKIRPAKRPDVDNVLKSVADALNGTAYDDDSQIVSVKAEKVYGLEPRVDVIIYPI